MAIHVGCSGMPVSRKKYVAALDTVELQFEQGVPPKASTAKKWASEAPDGFIHTVVAPIHLAKAPERLPPGLAGEVGDYGGLRPTEAALDLFGRALEAARALDAKAMVFVTPASIPPGPRGRDALRRFFEAVGPPPEGMRFAWEAHGPWDAEEVASLAVELGLVRCVDPLKDEMYEGAVAYGRLGPFACMGRALADDELEDICDALDQYDEAFCLFDTDRAFDDARRLRALCQG
jgi:uncharacterized protein YecE (DUF72 family)